MTGVAIKARSTRPLWSPPQLMPGAALAVGVLWDGANFLGLRDPRAQIPLVTAV